MESKAQSQSKFISVLTYWM